MDMTDLDRCSCGTPLDNGMTTCTPCRRELSRAVVPTVALPPSRPAEHGDITRPVLNRSAHRQLEFDLECIEGVDLDKLVAALHRSITVAAANPSTADGYPTSVPGAGPSSSHGPVDVGPWDPADDEHGPVTLVGVERAVVARETARRDKYADLSEKALGFFGDASRALRAAENVVAVLAKMQEHEADSTGDRQQCWAMARVGSDEPARSTVVIDGDPRPLGRWAYDFHRQKGRLPTVEECRLRARGRKVYIGTDARQQVTR